MGIIIADRPAMVQVGLDARLTVERAQRRADT